MQPLRSLPSIIDRARRGASRSQGVVEFAIALPVLLLLIFGIIDFSLLFSAWLLIQNMSRQAVRYAVTGQWDVANCAAGCVDQADQDAARLQSIIDKAYSYTAGLMMNGAATEGHPGYINVTVCSGRDLDNNGSSDFTTIYPSMGSTTYGECLPSMDPGGPGDSLVVIVDFDHPYITPLINDIWPMVHLVSYHQGIVEQFRFSRLIMLPPDIEVPTPTPSNTPTPSSTYTPTDTPTPSTTASSTPTETDTPTPTPTATPDCSLFSFSGWTQTTYLSKPRMGIYIRNYTGDDTTVDRVDFDWSTYDAVNPGQTLDRIRYDTGNLTTVDDPSSPTIWAAMTGPSLPASSSKLFYFDYLYLDSDWPGNAWINSFGITVTLGNGCVVIKEPIDTPTPTITRTPTRTYTPSTTSTITNTRTITNTPTRTYTPTDTYTPTVSRTPTSSYTPSPSFTITNTPTITRTPTVSNTPTRTYTPTISFTPTNSYTPSNTATPSFTPTRTFTPTITYTPTRTFTPTVSRTPTRTYTPTETDTPTDTPTRTSTRTPTRTATPNTPSPSPSRTRTVTPTPSNTICFDC